MADYTARWRIEGQNGMQAAFRSILGDAQSTSNKMAGIFRATFAGVSVVAVVTGIKRAMSAAIEYGDEVQKAALKTGLGASQFDKFAQAAKLADVEMTTLSKGFRTMQVSISEASTGSKSATEVFRALGIEFDQFKTLNAQQQLETIADQLVALKDPTDRARAGTALFGRAWDELAPFLLQGSAAMRAATDEVERMGGVLTNEQIQKLADADDSIKKLSVSWQGFSRTLAAWATPALVTFFNVLRKGLGGGTVTEQLKSELDELNAMIRRFESGHSGPATGINRNVYLRRRVVESQLAQLGDYSSSGPRYRGNAPIASATAPPGFQPDAGKQTKSKAVALFEDIPITAQKITASAMDAMYAEMDRATQTALDAQLKKWIDLETQIETLLHEGKISADDARARTSELVAAQFEEIKITARHIFPEQEETRLSAFADQAARNLQDSFAQFLFDPFKDGLKGMLAGFADTIRQMAAQLLASEILKAFFSWGAGLGGGFGAFFGRMANSVGRAGGGPVFAGSSYLVGERGPELFVPSSSGSIVRGGQGGGGMVVNVAPAYNIDARGATQDVIKFLPAILEENTRRTVAMAKAEIRNDVRRYGRIR